jgi:ATP-binding cassette, subfamily B, bacterial
VPPPAIDHWNFEHFVVIERWSPQQMEIIDPGSGRRRLKPTQFEAAFTGVVLIAKKLRFLGVFDGD